MIRREVCVVCQGTIVGSSDDWEFNARVVRRHNDSARHATDPTVAALRARTRRAERRALRAEVQLVRATRTSVRFERDPEPRIGYAEQTEYSGVQNGYHALRPLPGCTPGEGSFASRSTDEMHP